MKYKEGQRKVLHRKIKLLFLLVIIACCLYQIGSYVLNSYHNNKLNRQLQESYLDDIHEPKIEDIKAVENNEDISKEDNAGKFEDLLAINSDIVGWIKIENTNIDYPVVKAEDNDYYLSHNIKKESSGSGSIFMDYRNKGDAKDLNTIIYGHYMKDGSMFKDLTNYKEEEFLVSHPIIELDTLDKSTTWKIFSVYITDVNFNYIKTNFYNDDEYTDFLKEIKNKSLYDIGVNINSEDIILTLSTCTYEFYNARLAIHAKLIE